MNSLVHRIIVIASSRPISSASVLLRLLSFCCLDSTCIAPLPMVMIPHCTSILCSRELLDMRISHRFMGACVKHLKHLCIVELEIFSVMRGTTDKFLHN